MKKKISALIAALMLCSSAVYADGDVKVEYNGLEMTFPAAQPTIVNGRTMVPVRGLFDSMGFNIGWDADTKIATLSSPFVTVYATDGNIYGNDRDGKALDFGNDVMPQIINDRLYLPVRAIAECLDDVEVKWIENEKTVVITDNEEVLGDEGKMGYTEQEYVRTVVKKIEDMKQWAIDNDDPALLRFFGKKYTEGTEIEPIADNYSKIEKLMDDINELKVPRSMTEFSQPVSDFTFVLKSVLTDIQQEKDGKITPEELALKLDDYNTARMNVSQRLGVVWYNYFSGNGVYYEKVFGEYTLDVLN